MDKTQIKALTYTIVTVVGCLAALIFLFWNPPMFVLMILICCMVGLLSFVASEIYKSYLKSFRDKQ